MSRAFLVVMDSVGIGGAPDAHAYFNGDVPDTGANTFGHIRAACAAGNAEDRRSGVLKVPNLDNMGLSHALALAEEFFDMPQSAANGRWGAATEQSRGKDTPSGHWELSGLPVPWDWHYFPQSEPAFPPSLVQEVRKLAGTEGVLGNCHGSGTVMIDQLGPEHMKSGWPICYTSVDSVFQIAAHEQTFGLQALLDLCTALAPTLHAMKVGRVIARPFVGEPGHFERTANRRDFAIMPPAPVLTNWLQDAGRPVHAIGKIGDIFSMQGIDDVRKGPDQTLMQHLEYWLDNAEEGSLTFANFVEFDSLYGHRRDVAGYARHLEWFDACLGRLLSRLRPDDMLLITADHGNDPSWVGTDHTRERVPVLIAGQGSGSLGHIGFTDVAAMVAAHLGVPPLVQTETTQQ